MPSDMRLFKLLARLLAALHGRRFFDWSPGHGRRPAGTVIALSFIVDQLNLGYKMVRRYQTGMSLFNFLIAAAVTALIAFGAAPIYYRIANDMRTTAYANDLIATLNFARSAAITRATSISVCSSDDGQRCTDTDWTQGYIVFVDGATAGALDGTDQILSATKLKRPRVSVNLTGGNYVRFLRTGTLVAQLQPVREAASRSMLARLVDALSPISSAHASEFDSGEKPNTYYNAAASSNATFTVCAGVSGRSISVNALGRVNTTRISCQ